MSEPTDNPPTGIELASTEDYARLKTAYNIACENLAEINDNRNKMIEVLGNALTLVEHLMAEMSIAQVVPSSRCVFAKANLDAAMRKLLAK